MGAHVDYVPTPADVQHVRDQLIAKNVDDETVVRFLRADKGNLKTTAARLNDTMAWRQQVQPESLVCEMCRQHPGSHYMHAVGFSKQREPVLYSCLALAGDRSLHGNKDHMIMTFEQTVKLMPPGVEKWIWFSDLHGFGFRDLSPTIGKTFLDLASKHYPERLSCFVLCDAPTIFQTLYNMMLPLMDPVTRAKVKLIPYDISKEAKKAGSSKLRAFLDEHFEAATADWILQEMAENRKLDKHTRKHYDQVELRTAVKSGGELKRLWGTSDLLQKISDSPDVLLPNAGAAVKPCDGVS